MQPKVHQLDAEEPFHAGHGIQAQGDGAVQEAHDVFHGQVEPFGQVVGRHVAHAETVEDPQTYLLVDEVVHSGVGLDGCGCNAGVLGVTRFVSHRGG